MKIFYTASFWGKDKYQPNYNQVLSALQSHPIELESPELTRFPHPSIDPQAHYQAIRQGISWADAIVIEISQEDFQLGHEATLAIQAKKPVLCLSVNQDFTNRIQSRYFHAAKYTQYTIDEIIENFLKKAKKELLKERFNLFLSPNQLSRLRTQATKHSLTASEFIRQLIDKA